MIIEAGFDLFELFEPKLLTKRGRPRRQGTWVLAMDENLRSLKLTEVGGDASDVIENRINEIEKLLNNHGFRRVAYYSVAHVDTRLDSECSAVLSYLDKTLRLAPQLHEFENLGTYLSNGENVIFSGPRHSFRDYVGFEHLPRTATILGPHPDSCSCLACTQHEEIFQRHRLRYGVRRARKN